MANIPYDPAAIANKRFGGPGGTATIATTDQLRAKQATLTRSSTLAEATHLANPTTNPAGSPAKAPAAPTGNTTTVFTGLCDAINEFQRSLVRPGGYEIADVYEIQFSPASIGSSTVALKGEAYKASPTNQQKDPRTQLDQGAQKLDLTGRIVQVGQGTQIVQFIDQVMRQSSYITDQANFTIEESTGKLKAKENAPANADLKWYKINFQAKSLGFDKGRNDYAYRMIYTITPYTINKMDSQYFPDSNYRGVHKSYNYWFTGKNNSVISFEQDYNNMYYTILAQTVGGVGTGPLAGLKNVPATPSTEPLGKTKSTSTTPKSYAPAASVSSQGADNAANELGASAADFLYAMSPQGEMKIRIIGDPAWIAQGEITNSVNAATVNLSPFLPDGTINMDAGQVMFDLYFNRPADYNFDTGVVNVNAQTINPGGTLAALQPQAHLTYICSQVKSYFNQGKFEQEITGKSFRDGFDSVLSTAAAAQKTQQTQQQQREQNANDQATANGSRSVTPSAINTGSDNSTVGRAPEIDTAPAGDITNPSPQPAMPASPPVSNGDLTVTTNSAPENTLKAQIQNVADASGFIQQPLTQEQRDIQSLGLKNTKAQTMAANDDANGQL